MWISIEGIKIYFQVFGPLYLEASWGHELATFMPDLKE
jgi:hypothetical protein